MMLTDAQIIAKYGQPGDATKLTLLTLPYPMRIAWDTKTIVTRMQCHKLLKDRLDHIFTDLLVLYGLPELQRLGIDLFGGCVNVRPMRGSKTKWSRHAWGIAIDLDPSRNLLKETKKTARFARPEYKPMIDTFYNHDFLSYGIERNNDWMHFEASV